jgi:hypothetical protein
MQHANDIVGFMTSVNGVSITIGTPISLAIYGIINLFAKKQKTMQNNSYDWNVTGHDFLREKQYEKAYGCFMNSIEYNDSQNTYKVQSCYECANLIKQKMISGNLKQIIMFYEIAGNLNQPESYQGYLCIRSIFLKLDKKIAEKYRVKAINSLKLYNKKKYDEFKTQNWVLKKDI